MKTHVLSADKSYIIVATVALLWPGTNSPPKAESIVLGYSGANDFLGPFIAKDHGFFEKRGPNVTLTRVPNGSTLPAAMASGSVTVGTITPPLLLQAGDTGLPLKIFVAGSVQSRGNRTVCVIVRNGIEAPADFLGKKVSVPGLNSLLDVMFVRWLLNKGVDPAEVTFVEGGFPQFGIIMERRLDAALLVDPFEQKLSQASPEFMAS
jgi:NitT/TauT family transport system substrate-binding protein